MSEVHRHRFRTCQKQNSDTYSDFAFTLAMHFKRWMEGEKAYGELDRMREVIKLEQFRERLSPDLHSWLLDREPKTLAEAAKFADEYTAIRKAQSKSQKSTFTFNKSSGVNQYRSSGPSSPHTESTNQSDLKLSEPRAAFSS